jgi:enterochelin esterase-like enzyme
VPRLCLGRGTLGAFVQGLGFRDGGRSILWMSPVVKSPRTQVWLDSLGEWTWPGQHLAAAEVAPPSWVPAFPPAAPQASAQPLPEPWRRGRRLLIAVLLSALAAVCAALALRGPLGLEHGSETLPAAHRAAAAAALQPLPVLEKVSADRAGSTIEKASYHSVALHHAGSFYVYEPPGLRAAAKAGAGSAQRYPVIYLLHGNSQSARAFLQMGVQGELDTLIAKHAIRPMIAVMIQGGPGANNWRNIGDFYYESYVLEVQELVDRMLPTVARRGGRAIAGLSMGGYGAMELTLNNPYRFGVVESWLGFFNGLEDELRLDRHAISTLGLHAFLYGGRSDTIADPSENAPFAEQLRAAGAHAVSAVYPGEHNLETVHAHLPAMLTFAGRALAAGVAPAGKHAAR